MEEIVYEGEQYRLRAGAPMPIRGQGEFVLHTFMAEVNKLEVVMCTETLPASTDFRGQGGDLISASFSRIGSKDGKTFSGQRVYKAVYVDEEEI